MAQLGGWLQREKNLVNDLIHSLFQTCAFHICNCNTPWKQILHSHSKQVVLIKVTLFIWYYTRRHWQMFAQKCKTLCRLLLKLWVSTSFQLQNFSNSKFYGHFDCWTVNCASCPTLTNMIFPQLTFEMLQVFITSIWIGPLPLVQKASPPVSFQTS